MRKAKDKSKRASGADRISAAPPVTGRARKQAARETGAAKRSARRACNKPSGGGLLSEKEALALLNCKLEALEKQAAFLNFAAQETIDLIK